MSDQAPVGAVAAFGGLLSSSRTIMQAAGWLLCDGTSYTTAAPYDALYGVIKTGFGGATGTFNVPDLRGQFARGVSRDVNPPLDPNANARQPSAPGGNSGNAVGSTQLWATGLPTAPFTSDTNAGHTHTVPHVPDRGEANSVAVNAHIICEWNSDTVTTDPGVSPPPGGHTHTMSRGGDDETRPDNLYLHWFIKFDNASS